MHESLLNLLVKLDFIIDVKFKGLFTIRLFGYCEGNLHLLRP